MSEVGQSAPAFELPDVELNLVSLADFHEIQNVVLYLYPKDDAPGS